MAKRKTTDTVTAQSTGESAPSLGASQTFHNGITAGDLDNLLARGLGVEEQTETVSEDGGDDTPPVAEPVSESETQETSAEVVETQDDPDEILALGGEEKGQEDEESSADEPEWFKKRMAKMTRARREAEERAVQLEREIEELRGELVSSTRKTPDADIPFAHILTEDQLEAEKAKAEEVLDWCEDNRDGVVVDDKEFTAEDVANIRRNARQALRSGLPARAKYLREEGQMKALVDAAYPWWNDRSSGPVNAAQEVLKMFPEAKRHPAYKLLIGDMLYGRAMRERKMAEAAAGKKPQSIKPAPPQPSAPAARPAPVDKSAGQRAAALKRLSETGSHADLAALLSI